MSKKLTRTEDEYQEMRKKMHLYRGIVRTLNKALRFWKVMANANFPGVGAKAMLHDLGWRQEEVEHDVSGLQPTKEQAYESAVQSSKIPDEHEPSELCPVYSNISNIPTTNDGEPF